MDNQTACAVMSASETASDFKKSFICANDDLHQALLDSPLAIFVYVFGVLLVMFIVQRAAKPLPQKKNKKDDGNINNLLLKNGSSEKTGILKKKDNRNYKQISTYKPTGNLIYNTNLIKSISNVTDGNKKI